MTSDDTDLIYGEPRSEVLKGLLSLLAGKAPVGSDGLVELEIDRDMQFEGALGRATMRAEAELLLDDSGGWGETDLALRTRYERHVDALVRVITSCGALAYRETRPTHEH